MQSIKHLLLLWLLIPLLAACHSQSKTAQNADLPLVTPQNATYSDTELISEPQVRPRVQRATPTPVGIVVVQGSANLGRVQLFTIDEIIARTGILAWRQAGWTGYGAKVGILDRGFGNLEQFEQSNQLSVTLMPGEDRASYSGDSIVHGTRVAEIIHAIAPGTTLYVCRYNSFDQFTVCIDWMISSKVNIINHSAGVPALPLDGTNQWAREADRASRAGILWINAAGNFAHGMISDFFTDTNTNSYHEFRGVGTIETLAVDPIDAQTGLVMLSWEGTVDIPANEIDFDLELIDTNNQNITTSSLKQQGNPGETAMEYVVFPMNQRFGIRVRNVDGKGEQVRFVLFVEFASLPGSIAQGSIISPADSQSVLTIGGQQGNIIAPYSSKGPLVTGVIKPDLVAPAEIAFGDSSTFVGTSASAPVVAGAAALIWEANSAFTNEQLLIYLRGATQDDNEIPGLDSNYGMGRLYLALPQTTPTPMPATPTPMPTVSQSPTKTGISEASPTTTPTLTISTPNQTASTSSDSGPVAIVQNMSVNLRNGPGTEYDVVGVAYQGDALPILAQANEWYIVAQPDDRQAWIASWLVEVTPANIQIEAAATIPPTPQTADLFSVSNIRFSRSGKGLSPFPSHIEGIYFFVDVTVLPEAANVFGTNTKYMVGIGGFYTSAGKLTPNYTPREAALGQTKTLEIGFVCPHDIPADKTINGLDVIIYGFGESGSYSQYFDFPYTCQ